jgi:hypothetical protein
MKINEGNLTPSVAPKESKEESKEVLAIADLVIGEWQAYLQWGFAASPDCLEFDRSKMAPLAVI